MLVVRRRQNVTLDRTIGPEKENAGFRLSLDKLLCDSDPWEEMSSRASSGEDV